MSEIVARKRPCAGRHPEPLKSGCRLCFLYLTRPDYKALWDGEPIPNHPRQAMPVPITPIRVEARPTPAIARFQRQPCIHQGEATGEMVACASCGGRKTQLKVLACALHEKCLPTQAHPGIACCRICPDYTVTPLPAAEAPALVIGHAVSSSVEAAPGRDLPSQAILPHRRRLPAYRPLVWAYGLTCVPSRRKTYLPRTLASLHAAGFSKPHLFVDGDRDAASWEKEFGCEVTCRYPKIRTHGNWVLGLYELFLRNPTAHRYAMFQDDFVTYPHLKEYLERIPYPEKGYENCYSFPENEARCPKDASGNPRVGWYRSNQNGLGAVALVFDRKAVMALLSHSHLVNRATDPHRGHRNIDGGIVETMKQAGYIEYCHFPSLTQHIGEISSMQNREQAKALSFRGEGFDALNLVPVK